MRREEKSGEGRSNGERKDQERGDQERKDEERKREIRGVQERYRCRRQVCPDNAARTPFRPPRDSNPSSG